MEATAVLTATASTATQAMAAMACNGQPCHARGGTPPVKTHVYGELGSGVRAAIGDDGRWAMGVSQGTPMHTLEVTH